MYIVLMYFLRFRVVWRLRWVKNTFARTFARFARFARTLPTPVCIRRKKSLTVETGVDDPSMLFKADATIRFLVYVCAFFGLQIKKPI
jgi:hypothetical protein